MLELNDGDLARLRRTLFRQILGEFSVSRGLTPPVVRDGGLLLKDHHGRPVHLKFDEQGFIHGFQDDAGRWQLTLDRAGRAVALDFPDGSRLVLERDPQGRLIRLVPDDSEAVDLEYDTGGNLSALVFADHGRYHFEYDAGGRLLARTDRLKHREQYRRDAQGNLREIVEASGHVWRFEYRDWDRPIRVQSPDQRQYHCHYDPQGRLRELALGDGNSEPSSLALLHFADEHAHLPDTVSFADGEILRFQYDARERLRNAGGTGPAVAFQYDEAGHLLWERQAHGEIGYEHGEHHGCTGFHASQGPRASIGYDRALRVKSLQDGLGQQYRWHQGTDTLALRLPNGLIQHCQWRSGRRLHDSLQRADGTPLLESHYQHDTLGQLRTLARDGRRWHHEYDAEGRLVSLDEGDGPLAFQHDPAGRCLRQYGIPQHFDEAGRLIGHGQHMRLGYDARGRVEKLRRDDQQWRFRYNDRDLLITAETTDQRLEFGYDALGRRVFKRCRFTDGRPEHQYHYRWAGERLIQTRRQHPDGETHWDFYHVPGTALPLGMVLDGVWYGYHLDHRGAPMALSDSAGELVWRGECGLFGACRGEGTVTPPQILPGVQFDPETGLHYDRFRYYEPHLGWYLTPDPLGLLRGLCPYRHRGDGHLDARVRQWPADADSAARLSPGAILVVTAPDPLLRRPAPAPLPLLQHFLGENLNARLEREWLLAAPGDGLEGRQLFAASHDPYPESRYRETPIQQALAGLATEPERGWRHFREF